MTRVKIIKDRDQYKKGETVEVTPNIAHGLIDSGYATLTKDMVASDYKAKPKKTRKTKKFKGV